jgi:site-specific DNA-methyltransferase (adenine-specific)
MKIDLRLGDCLEVLKTIPDNSIDAVITDPPYGIGFMNKEWDNPEKLRQQQERDLERSKIRNENGTAPVTASFSPFPGQGYKGRKEGLWFQQWCQLWAEECLRILKPGGHILSFSAPRTYHRMASAFEDAGFEIRDQLMWVFGSGFPKSHNIGKAIDKIEGNEREIVGRKIQRVDGTTRNLQPNGGFMKENVKTKPSDGYIDIEKPGSENSEKWEGWGTALKPAHEPIVMARKPLSEKSIAENVLKHGTGGINIDGSRIEMKQGDKMDIRRYNEYHDTFSSYEEGESPKGKEYIVNEPHEGGRFPANIIFDEEAGQLLDEQSGERGNGWKKNYGKEDYNGLQYSSSTQQCIFGGGYNGKNTYSDKGGASRFFYCPKAAKKDRGEGIELINNHPTVKPTDLMRYLINLITPPNGTILDPFMGSGSTGKAAVRCGLNFIGIEKEQEYMDIASARIEHEKNKPIQTKLFDGQ